MQCSVSRFLKRKMTGNGNERKTWELIVCIMYWAEFYTKSVHRARPGALSSSVMQNSAVCIVAECSCLACAALMACPYKSWPNNTVCFSVPKLSHFGQVGIKYCQKSDKKAWSIFWRWDVKKICSKIHSSKIVMRRHECITQHLSIKDLYRVLKMLTL